MKKIIVAVMMVAGFAGITNAKVVSKKKAKAHVPYAQNPNIDHSKDVAFSAQWADKAVSPAANADFSMMLPVYAPAVTGRTYYYGYPLSNFTKNGYRKASMNAAYNGDFAPAWDGPIKNEYRNRRANNTSAPLPPANGNGPE